MAKLNGGEIIVESLIDRGVPYLFGLCGHGIVGLMDAARDRADKLPMISVHNEQVAGFMADVYYRVTGTPVATFTSCGPGSVNIEMPVATAFHDASAMLAITGNIPTGQFNKMPFQETGEYHQADFPSSIRPYVKRSYQATRADMLPDMMCHAQDLMVSGRPGPVNLDVPFNVFTEEAEFNSPCPDATRIRGAGAQHDDVMQAVEMLTQAERPLILAGYGALASGAGEVIRKLAEALNIPVATTPQGKGLFDDTHPLMLGPTARDGVYAANRAARGCDVLLAFGTRFGDRSTSAWEPGVTHDFAHQKLIHVEIDPSRLGRNYRPDLAICADAGQVARQILLVVTKGAKQQDPAHSKWLSDTQGWKRDWITDIARTAKTDGSPIHPERAMSDINRLVPPNTVVVSDIGSVHGWVVQQFEMRDGRQLVQSGGFATMGIGVCGSLGAQVARPDQPVVAMVGDGGFLMHASVVATAVEYDLPVIWIVWNNGGYVSIRDIQKGFFGADRTCATMFQSAGNGAPVSADFAMLGRAMGADGYTAEKPGDLAAALQAALAGGRPAVIDARINPDAYRRSAGVWNLADVKGARPNYDPSPVTRAT